MAWLIGVDEAGYGPNLGPLCIAATAWRVGNHALAPSATTPGPSTYGSPVDLYELFAPAVSRTPTNGAVAIADSKALYKPGGGLALLERGVLGALSDKPRFFSELLDATGADSARARAALPWYSDFNCCVPLDATRDDVLTAKEQLRGAGEGASVALETVRARMVFPAEFNELCGCYGTKGAALSHVTLALVREVIDSLPANRQSLITDHLTITCDKHGGRNRYAGLLQHHFPEQWIDTIVESRAASRYRWGSTEITFRPSGEVELPVALSSMTAKYLRELAMRAFNAFWASHVSGLKPTAGYPVDAGRFKADIQTKQRELGIDDRVLWRDR